LKTILKYFIVGKLQRQFPLIYLGVKVVSAKISSFCCSSISMR